MSTLSDSQLKALSVKLDAREAQLRDEVKAVNSDEQESPSAADMHAMVADFGERAEHRLRAEVRYAEKERDIDELRAIAAAKERLAHGVFGACVDCGADIPLARLQVQPACARCLPCQEKFEQTHPVGPRILPSPGM